MVGLKQSAQSPGEQLSDAEWTELSSSEQAVVIELVEEIRQLKLKVSQLQEPMRWTREGAHLLLQVRLQVINQDWRGTFRQWYPGMQPESEIALLAA